MARKGYKPEQVINKLREAEILLNQGSTVGEASKKIGVTEQTYYRWAFSGFYAAVIGAGAPWHPQFFSLPPARRDHGHPATESRVLLAAASLPWSKTHA